MLGDVSLVDGGSADALLWGEGGSLWWWCWGEWWSPGSWKKYELGGGGGSLWWGEVVMVHGGGGVGNGLLYLVMVRPCCFLLGVVLVL